MINARRAGLTGLSLLLVVGAAAGCQSDSSASPASSSAPPPSAAAKDALAASLPKASEAQFHFTIKGDEYAQSGVVGGKTKTALLALDGTTGGTSLSMNYLLIGKKVWLKVKIGGSAGASFPDKWLLIDPAKLTDKDSVPSDYDSLMATEPGSTDQVVDNATTVTQTSPTQFSGVTDLTGSSDGNGLLDTDTVTALGEKVKAIPFTATLDAKGRLSSMTVNIPAAGTTPASTSVTTYDQYGTAAVPSLPTAANSVKAPAAAYSLLNGS